MKRPPGFMDINTFSALLRQIDWEIDKLDFGYSGEPLLNKDIFKMIKMASHRGLPTGFDTNGMELIDCVDDILSSGLKFITVAIDGVDQASASQFRKGVDFKRVYEGIKELCRKRNSKGQKAPRVTMQTIITKDNYKDIAKIEGIAKEAGADRLVLKSMNLNVGFWLSADQRQELAERYLPQDLEYSRYSRAVLPKNKRMNPCIFPLNDMVVLYNGDVTLCCLDFNAAHIVGNIFRKPLRDIWRSRLYAEHRNKVFKMGLPMCRNCDFTENSNKITDLSR